MLCVMLCYVMYLLKKLHYSLLLYYECAKFLAKIIHFLTVVAG